jgi:hypothetical protein
LRESQMQIIVCQVHHHAEQLSSCW